MMIIRTFLDDFINRIKECILKEGEHRLCQLHDSALPYHYGIGLIKGLQESIQLAEELYNKKYPERISMNEF